MKSIEEKITDILQELGLWDVKLSIPVSLQMDSIDLTALIVSLEDEYGIEITDENRYDCNTLDDYVSLIQCKLIAKNKLDTLKEAGMLTYPESPPIEDQIKFIEDFVVDPEMSKAIRENLITLRLQQQIRHAAKTDSNAMVYPLSTVTVKEYPTTPTEAEPPFNHPSDNTSERPFTRGL